MAMWGELLRGILSAGGALPQGMDAAASRRAAEAKTAMAQKANDLALMKLLQADTHFQAGEAGKDRRLGMTEAGLNRRFDAGETGRNVRAGESNKTQRERNAEIFRHNQWLESPITVPPVPRKPGDPDAGHVVVPPVDPRGVAPILKMFGPETSGRGTEAKLRVELSEQLLRMEREIAAGTRAGDDPEYVETARRLDRHARTPVPAYGGISGAGTEFSPVGPNAPAPAPAAAGPAAPTGRLPRGREPMTPPSDAARLGVLPGGTVRDDLAAARKAGRAPFTAAQQGQYDAAQQSKGLLEVVERDLQSALKTATPVKGPMDKILGIPGRFWDVHMQANPELATIHDRIQGTLAKLARAFGEVGTLNEGDIERARKLWPVLAPGFSTWDFGVFKLPIFSVTPDTNDVVVRKIAGLKEFLNELEGRIAQPRSGQMAPAGSAAPSRAPAVNNDPLGIR